MKKIAIIAPSEVPSNTANSIQVMKVCQALQDCGKEVALWVPGDGQENWEYLSKFYGITGGFKIHWVSSWRGFRRYDMAVKALLQAARWGADLIYTWMPQTAVFALWMNIPAVLEIHMMPSGRIGPWLFKRFVISKKKKVLLPITNALRVMLEDTFHLELSENVLIAPMGVELEHYTNLPDPRKARNMLGLPEKFTAGYTGHFYPGRGMDVLLELARAHPAVSFLWTGGKPEDVAYWRARLEVEEIENVVLTGFIENDRLPLYQAAAEVLMMPYEWSVGVSSHGDTAAVCSPMKMFDYLAAGRVIMSSDLPVLHEVLNESNAIFCRPEKPADWITAFGEILSNTRKRKKLSNQAQQDAQQYAWVERARKTLNLLSN